MKKIILSLSLLLLIGCSDKDFVPTKNIDKNQRVINGYTVPPEPDEKLNNSTVLGIDSDNNGVRDDVDRLVALNFPDPVKHALAIQGARATQITLSDPTNGWNKRLDKESDKQVDCLCYLTHNYPELNINKNKTYKVDDLVMNTRLRRIAQSQYESSLSGHHFSLDKDNDLLKCPKLIQEKVKEIELSRKANND
jgi:hypothetical protein